ncbi:MAG: serine/threonine-protein phosphatase [Armatimonadetes bacterium]|nr:serine/threonine-protein phosphatase [Armatimonadota bacterium]
MAQQNDITASMLVPALAKGRGSARMPRSIRPPDNESDLIVALFRTLLVAVVLVMPSVASTDLPNRTFYLVAGGAATYCLVSAVAIYRRVVLTGLRPLFLAVDTLLLTVLISHTGGQHGGLFGLYYLTVIVGAMWFGAAGAVGAAAFATLCAVASIQMRHDISAERSLRLLQQLMMPNAELLFLAAVLAGYLAESWRQERRQADEQQKVLDQFKRQMDMAQELQTLVLPPTLPKVPGVEIGIRARQAAVVVGGDYYDAVAFADGAVGVCSADVSGKSVPGQLRLPLVKYAFRVCAQQFRQPEVVMPKLGGILYKELPPEMFVSMVYAVVEPHRDRIKMCRAGHCPPLKLVASTGEVEELWEPTGCVFGVEPDMRYDVARIPFRPDDYLVFYTDGAIEALDKRGNELEVGGLAKMLAQAAPESAQDLANWLFGEIEAYEVGAKRDDLTLVVIRRTTT